MYGSVLNREEIRVPEIKSPDQTKDMHWWMEGFRHYGLLEWPIIYTRTEITDTLFGLKTTNGIGKSSGDGLGYDL